LNQNAQQLTAMGTAPTNTNIAASQLQSGQDAAARSALAMAGSGRSIGGGAAAMQQAQFANAQGQQATNQQAATANLQEQMQNRQMQLQALGGAQNAYGQVGQQTAGITAGNIGLQATNAGLAQNQQGINNQTSATYGQIGQGLNSSALGQEGMSLGQQQLANTILSTQLGAGEQYQGSINGQSIAQQNLNNQQTGMALGAASAAAGAYGQYAGSDRDVKQNIKPAIGDDEGWLSHMLWHGGFGGGHHAEPVPVAAPPAMMRDPNNPSHMISAYGNISAASHGAGQQQLANVQGHAMQAAQMGGPDQRTQANLDMLHAYAPATADTWGGGAPPTAAYPPDAGPPPAPWLQDYMQQQQAPQPMAASDVNAKSNVTTVATKDWHADRPSPYQPISDASHYAGHVTFRPTGNDPYPLNPPMRVASDEHSKTRIAELEGQLAALSPRAPDTAGMDEAYRREGGQPVQPPGIDLRPAQPFSYEYKDPARFGAGRFYGPMAQDLERTPAGASIVKQAPDGTKMVDTSRGALLALGAVSDLQRQQEVQARKDAELQRQLDALRPPDMASIPRARAGTYPSPMPTGVASY
jgi:hypothetical protein